MLEDPKIQLYNLLQKIAQEEKNSECALHMTANENIMSENAKNMMKSKLSTRYYSDTYDPENRPFNQKCYSIGNAIYKGLPAVLEFEEIARRHANHLFSAAFSDFIPLSGMHAVICIITALTMPGDKIFCFSTKSVGHHATNQLFKSLGRIPIEIPWDFTNLTIDLCAFSELFHKEKPSTIFLDLGRPLYPLPVREIREIIGTEVKLIYDASHVLGLIAGGQFQNPLEEGADILIGNTHKTFPGPQKAILLYANEELGRKTGLELFSSSVSSQHTHHSLALYATILEMSVHGKAYAEQVINNSKAFSKALLALGFELVSRKNELPKSHMIALKGFFPNGSICACQDLHHSNISTNTQRVFGFDCVRAGIQELTRRGMKETEMVKIASFFKQIILDGDRQIEKEVHEFSLQFQNVFYTLDTPAIL